MMRAKKYELEMDFGDLGCILSALSDQEISDKARNVFLMKMPIRSSYLLNNFSASLIS